jgi:hypothetical protein
MAAPRSAVSADLESIVLAILGRSNAADLSRHFAQEKGLVINGFATTMPSIPERRPKDW